jgi:hypothetical protein
VETFGNKVSFVTLTKMPLMLLQVISLSLINPKTQRLKRLFTWLSLLLWAILMMFNLMDGDICNDGSPRESKDSSQGESEDGRSFQVAYEQLYKECVNDKSKRTKAFSKG